MTNDLIRFPQFGRTHIGPADPALNSAAAVEDGDDSAPHPPAEAPPIPSIESMRTALKTASHAQALDFKDALFIAGTLALKVSINPDADVGVRQLATRFVQTLTREGGSLKALLERQP